LKSYADSKGYNVSNITKDNWNATIAKLEEIQAARVNNSEQSIYTNTGEADNWSTNKMIVHEGSVEFTETELNSLYTAMGLEIPTDKVGKEENITTEKGQAFHAFTVEVATGKNPQDFVVKAADKRTQDEYNADLEELSKSYIKTYDTDGDSMISFDEFYNHDLNELKETYNRELTDEEKAALEATKPGYQLSFDRQNVDNEGDSKAKLDFRELMNFFFTMDSLTPNEKNELMANGKVSADEFATMNTALSDTEIGDGETIETWLKNNFGAHFQNYKK